MDLETGVAEMNEIRAEATKVTSERVKVERKAVGS